MPYMGPWGTFIHIPKTGGTFVRQCLHQTQTREQNKSLSRGTKAHDLPSYWWDAEIWTSVREPAEWLCSVWAWMERTAWRTYPHQVPWHHFVDYLVQGHKKRWPKFVESICNNSPGLVGWFYGIYVAPNVTPYRLGPHLYRKLKEIGCNPGEVGTQVNAAKNEKPEITDEQRLMIYNAEKATYERYGFDPPNL